jgi:hypothetical protein
MLGGFACRTDGAVTHTELSGPLRLGTQHQEWCCLAQVESKKLGGSRAWGSREWAALGGPAQIPDLLPGPLSVLGAS